MSMNSIIKLLSNMQDNEEYVDDLKEKTLDIVSKATPIFVTADVPPVKVGRRVFYGNQKKSIYLLFKLNERILIYVSEFELDSDTEEQGKEPIGSFVLREVMEDDEFKDILLEDDEEYIQGHFDKIPLGKGETIEQFVHKNSIWLLNLSLN